MRATRLLVPLAALLGTCLTAFGQARPAAPDVPKLIARLGSPRYAERMEATQKLEAIGPPALPALREAADRHDSAEVRRRARQLVRALESPSYGEVRQLRGHTALVYSLAFTADGRRLLSASYDKTVRLWEVSTGKELARFNGHEAAYGVLDADVSPDGRLALVGTEGGAVYLFAAETGKLLAALEGHRGRVVQVAFAPGSGRALSASHDGTVRLWDLKTRQELHVLRHGAAVWGAAFGPGGKRVVSGGVDGTWRLWDAATGRGLKQVRVGGVVMGVALAPDGRRVATAADDQVVRLWDVEGGRELRGFRGHTEPVTRVLFSPDGRRLLSCGMDRTVRLWDAESGRELRCFRAHRAAVYSIAFTPDGRLAASGGGDDHAIRLWRLPE